MYSSDISPKFTNPLESTIENRKKTLNFKESTSKPDNMELFEEMRKVIISHEDYKHWNIFRRKGLNLKNTIIYMEINDKEGTKWEAHQTQAYIITKNETMGIK